MRPKVLGLREDVVLLEGMSGFLVENGKGRGCVTIELERIPPPEGPLASDELSIWNFTKKICCCTIS